MRHLPWILLLLYNIYFVVELNVCQKQLILLILVLLHYYTYRLHAGQWFTRLCLSCYLMVSHNLCVRLHQCCDVVGRLASRLRRVDVADMCVLIIINLWLLISVIVIIFGIVFVDLKFFLCKSM